MHLAENMKTLRAQAGETQNDIASLLGVTTMTVSRYESGEIEPSISMLTRLSSHYDVTIDELVLRRMEIDLPLHVKNMKYLRKKHGMSVDDIAKLLGVRSAAYCRFEYGILPIEIEMLGTATEFFGVTLDQMVRQDLAEEEKTHDECGGKTAAESQRDETQETDSCRG